MAYEELIARLEASADVGEDGYPMLLNEAADALRELSKDAERYRWLRGLAADPCIVYRRDVRKAIPLHWADAAIDVAMEPK